MLDGGGLTRKVHFPVVDFCEDLIPGIFLSTIPTSFFPTAGCGVPGTLTGGMCMHLPPASLCHWGGQNPFAS